MVLLVWWILLRLGTMVAAQSWSTTWTVYYATPSAPTTASSSPIMAASVTSSAPAATHTIKVGSKDDPHQYSPHNITAAVGDIVEFQFYPRNHSVVKADYGAPCVPAANNVFYSGSFNNFVEQNGQLMGPPPKWYLIVNDTQPTFFYCTAVDSCIGNGMVGVINPNASMTWETQYQKAKQYPYMLVPGQSMPAEGDLPSSTSSPPSSSNTSSPNTTSSGTHLSSGAIAGIAIGAAAFVAILIALFFTLGRNRVYKQWMSSQDATTDRTARWAFFHGEQPWRQKSDMGSSAQHTADQATLPASPDPTQRTFSPGPGPHGSYSQQGQGQGHWSWEASSSPGFVPPPQMQMRAPTELDASDSMRRGG
ncbi:hypothetical protein FE257_001103 [Aspergillus nanangensis]|uniref:Extracellular serine-rich protein n=1 Tax=Aspergillus nanangensis TaxID=2582783 RepID=A0AAD4CUB5_ASPNN|nr:hypothetical protein FE257_001103 [Aspergillus nanangensis]